MIGFTTRKPAAKTRLLRSWGKQLALAACMATATLAQAAEPAVMRLVHVAPLDHQMTWSLQTFAAEVKDRTKGQVVVDVVTKPRPMPDWHEFPNLVAKGDLEAAAIPNFFWVHAMPEMDVWMIPHFFTSLDQMRKFPGSDAAQLLEKKFNAMGVQTLGWMHASRLSVFHSIDKPILVPADLKGRKITSMDAFNGQVMALSGATPVELEPYQVAGALKSGQIDSILTDIASSVGLQYDTMTKYVTIAPYFSAFYHVFINPKWMAGLSAENRAAIEASAKNLNKVSELFWEGRAAAAPDVFKWRGKIQVHIQTPQETAEWVKETQQPAIDQFVKRNPTDGKQLVDLMRKL